MRSTSVSAKPTEEIYLLPKCYHTAPLHPFLTFFSTKNLQCKGFYPTFAKYFHGDTRAFSSVGQSNRLIIWRSQVQALDGPLADNGSYPLFLFGRALTVPTYRTPQGVTVPRCLRLTAVGTIETSPYGSAFTYGYLLRSISLHRLRRQQTTESMGLYKTNLKPKMARQNKRSKTSDNKNYIPLFGQFFISQSRAFITKLTLMLPTRASISANTLSTATASVKSMFTVYFPLYY